MYYYKKIIFVLIIFIFPKISNAFVNEKINFEKFSLNKYEITIQEFKKYAIENNITTEAEKTGGGYEWGAGWEKRNNWNYQTPYGKKPESELEPAVHISRFEADNYCKYIGGRLPTFEEWSFAAYSQYFDSDKFEKGKTYKYPSGDEAKDMNSQGLLDYNKHVDVTTLPNGINNLIAMGGNVWEWVDDQRGESSLTAGASWWYGGSKTSKGGAQYKPSDFYAIYVGFRCAFDLN
jgi:sulfatase modifying factor 1